MLPVISKAKTFTCWENKRNQLSIALHRNSHYLGTILLKGFTLVWHMKSNRGQEQNCEASFQMIIPCISSFNIMLGMDSQHNDRKCAVSWDMDSSYRLNVSPLWCKIIGLIPQHTGEYWPFSKAFTIIPDRKTFLWLWLLLKALFCFSYIKLSRNFKNYPHFKYPPKNQDFFFKEYINVFQKFK